MVTTVEKWTCRWSWEMNGDPGLLATVIQRWINHHTGTWLRWGCTNNCVTTSCRRRIFHFVFGFVPSIKLASSPLIVLFILSFISPNTYPPVWWTDINITAFSFLFSYTHLFTLSHFSGVCWDQICNSARGLGGNLIRLHHICSVVVTLIWYSWILNVHLQFPTVVPLIFVHKLY